MDILGCLMVHHTTFAITSLFSTHQSSTALFLIDRPCIEIGGRDQRFAVVVRWKSIPNTGRDDGLQQAENLPRSVSNRQCNQLELETVLEDFSQQLIRWNANKLTLILKPPFTKEGIMPIWKSPVIIRLASKPVLDLVVGTDQSPLMVTAKSSLICFPSAPLVIPSSSDECRMAWRSSKKPFATTRIR